MHRCYSPSPLGPGELRLEDSEAHHLANVLRARAGDVVEVFDGIGGAARGPIRTLSKKGVTIEMGAVTQEPVESRRLTLATAVPKGDRCDWLVEKATELGVARWVPLSTERSVVEPRGSKLDRLRQVVISACKQSGRNRLMEIAPVMSWHVFLDEIPTTTRLLIAAPEGNLWTLDNQSTAELCIAIGPEGGWTDQELQSAREHNANAVSLGPHILRIETAALAAAAAWRMT